MPIYMSCKALDRERDWNGQERSDLEKFMRKLTTQKGPKLGRRCVLLWGLRGGNLRKSAAREWKMMVSRFVPEMFGGEGVPWHDHL